MKTPSGAFVLFQFCGEHAGKVMFRPGPTVEARANFAKLVLELDTKLAGNGYERIRCDGARHSHLKVSFLRYRVAPGVTETWFGTPEGTLSDLCADFGDKVAHAK